MILGAIAEGGGESISCCMFCVELDVLLLVLVAVLVFVFTF